MSIVYYNEVSINIKSSIEDDASSQIHYSISSKKDTIAFIKNLLNTEFTKDIVLFGQDSNIILQYMIGQFKYIEAAGGMVQNPKNEYLLIRRLGVWDLPKGKIEKGESVKEAAIREVCEETGINNVKIVKSLPHTFHVYQRRGNWYLKKTYWFLMNTKDTHELVPQTDEDISEALWMGKSEAKKAISKSYRSIKDTLGYLIS